MKISIQIDLAEFSNTVSILEDSVSNVLDTPSITGFTKPIYSLNPAVPITLWLTGR